MNGKKKKEVGVGTAPTNWRRKDLFFPRKLGPGLTRERASGPGKGGGGLRVTRTEGGLGKGFFITREKESRRGKQPPNKATLRIGTEKTAHLQVQGEKKDPRGGGWHEFYVNK